MSTVDTEPGMLWESVHGNDAACLEQLHLLMVQHGFTALSWCVRNACYRCAIV